MKAKQTLFWVTFLSLLITACASFENSPSETAPFIATETPSVPSNISSPKEAIEPTDPPATVTETIVPPTALPSNTPEASASATETIVPVTPTALPSSTPEASATPTETIVPPTALPSSTPEASATPTETIVPPTALPSSTPKAPATPTETIVPPTALPSSTPEAPATATETIVPVTSTALPSSTPLPPPTEPLATEAIPTIAATETSDVHLLPEESGIEGRVEIGPTCGNAPIEGDTDCSNQPYQAYLTITDMNGQVVAEGQSDANGYYRFSLPPGKYRLVPENKTTLLSTDSIEFTVTPGTFIYVLVLYDTLIP